ncbi:MAG: DUF5668 domain-containing protein [Bryobacterales bacterium]|nr:DUF5668 domain-containing protein [Bryobacterales bacterium]
MEGTNTNTCQGRSLIAAIRGPILMITVGGLFAIDHAGLYSFSSTWPAILIVIGVMKLMERAAAPRS